MSESTAKTLTQPPGDAPLNAGIHEGSSDDGHPKNDPTKNTPSQILLEALRNFVVPLIHAADEKNQKDISEVYSSLEAGKLLTALQEFISSMIIQSRVDQPQFLEVDLEGVNVDDVASDYAMAESLCVATDSTASDPGPSKDSELKVRHQRFIIRVGEVVRERVFSKMPIRVLHFTDIPRDPGTKLQITLLDRNGIFGRIMEKIQANWSQRWFEAEIEKFRWKWDGDERSIEDSIIEKSVPSYTRYGVLSHTWLPGSGSEVTYGAWQIGRLDTQRPGYQKLANFCKSAWKDHGLSFGWMDTVCINKDSSVELDESIRSMHKWYQSSDICITYLAETLTLDNIHRDPWFTRGWTFQELLAPDRMTFYGKDWNKFILYSSDDKFNPDILVQISRATTITANELLYPNEMPISRKMQLAARRNVTREEDIAYSLMGICGVSISIAYGEGAKRAFSRLMTAILNNSRMVFDIFNCAQTGGFSTSIIPSAPSAYLPRSEAIGRRTPPIEPLLLTHVGLRIPILLMPSLRENDPFLKNNPIGDYHAMFHLPALNARDIGPYYLLDKGITTSNSSKWQDLSWILDSSSNDNAASIANSDITAYRSMFGIMNFGGGSTSISVPYHCLAVCFRWPSEPGVRWDLPSIARHRISTKEPIVFQLMNKRTPNNGGAGSHYSLERRELAKHGMTLTTMYL